LYDSLNNNLQDLISLQSIPLISINNDYHQPKQLINIT